MVKTTSIALHLDDDELLSRFKNPSSKNYAFNLLTRKYQERIYWHIRKMVISHDDTDDLVQDTFVKIWKNLEKFKGNSQLYTWIYRIATNECLSFLTKKRKRFFIPIHDITKDLANKLESDINMDGSEIQFKLQKALLTLPDKQRLVFNMKYFDEMKYQEISAILGTSIGALKASYHLAVKKVEKILKNED